MIKVTFTTPTLIIDSGNRIEANFVFVKKVIFEEIETTPIINWDRLFISIKKNVIKSIEPYNPSEI